MESIDQAPRSHPQTPFFSTPYVLSRLIPNLKSYIVLCVYIANPHRFPELPASCSKGTAKYLRVFQQVFKENSAKLRVVVSHTPSEKTCPYL